MQRTRHRFGFMAAAILPLLLGGCLSGGVPGGVPGGDGFGYRPVFRTAHGTAGMGHPAPGAGARQLALAPDGRMKWIAAPSGWRSVRAGWAVPPRQAGRVGSRRVYTPAPAEVVNGFVLPVSGAVLTSGFGMREHPILGGDRLHAGIDLAAPTGTPVRAAVAGTVEAAGRNGGYGNYVRIGHGPLSTAYAHLDGYAPGIAPGVAIDAGEVIGYVGSTGRSTGPHLHFEVLVGEDSIDPMSVIPAAIQVALGNAPRVELARGGR